MFYRRGSRDSWRCIRAKNFFRPSLDILHTEVWVWPSIIDVVESSPRLGCWEIISQQLAEYHEVVIACGGGTENRFDEVCCITMQ